MQELSSDIDKYSRFYKNSIENNLDKFFASFNYVNSH